MFIGHQLPMKPMDMRNFNPMEFVEQARRHLQTLTDPRQRVVCQNFIDHAEAEMSGDYAALMASCSRKRQSYFSYGTEANMQLPQSYEELELHYWNLIAYNIHILQLDMEKLTVGHDTLCVEGILHQLYSGAQVEQILGVKLEEPEGIYQYTSRVTIFFVFDEEGLGAGEHSYSGNQARREDFVLVPREHVPPRYFKNPLSGMTFRPGIADEMLLAKASD
jgi:hypothetical protein